ncbi:MAG: hypothetical protein RI907_2487, partial [Pseudomonadota bacterium]
AGVPAAVAECKAAGVRVVMITGDAPETARAIGRTIGLDDTQPPLTGRELEALSDGELARRLPGLHVFARVVPEQKLRLVQALRAQGEVVAMTGDGVNDAPALKAAHVGVAMGQRGSDVAREAAALVLMHDDFAALVEAIARGRRTFDNLRRALVYTIAVHIPIVALAMLPVLLGLPLVLTPLHIAFLELVIDPSCSLAFEAEEADADVMRRPPRRRDESVVPGRILALAVGQGLAVTALVMGGYMWALQQPAWQAVAGTLAFTLLVTANAGLILPSRLVGAGRGSLLGGLPVVTRWVMGLTLLALAVFTATPLVAGWLGLQALPLTAWAACVAAGLAMALPLWAINLAWAPRR